MTVEEFHIDIRTTLNEGQGRYFSPLQIDSAINKGILDHFKDEYRMFEETQEITDTLGFFKSYSQQTVASGQVTIPADFHHITELEAVLSDNTVKPLTLIKDGEWARKKDSKGFPANALYPVGRQNSNKIDVLPLTATGIVGVSKVNIYYLRKPAVAKFNFTEAGGNYGFVYNNSGSVQVDWPSIDHNRILLKALGYLGIPIQNQVVIQSEQIKRPSGA